MVRRINFAKDNRKTDLLDRYGQFPIVVHRGVARPLGGSFVLGKLCAQLGGAIQFSFGKNRGPGQN